MLTADFSFAILPVEMSAYCERNCPNQWVLPHPSSQICHLSAVALAQVSASWIQTAWSSANSYVNARSWKIANRKVSKQDHIYNQMLKTLAFNHSVLITNCAYKGSPLNKFHTWYFSIISTSIKTALKLAWLKSFSHNDNKACKSGLPKMQKLCIYKHTCIPNPQNHPLEFWIMHQIYPLKLIFFISGVFIHTL